MNKLFEVKEFDTIVSNPAYEHDDQIKYLDKKHFDNLIKFIQEFEGTDENADALDFMRIGYKRAGETISLKNYVGLIQMKDGFQVQVLPKIDFGTGEDSDNSKTRAIFLKMLKSLKDFPSKTFNEANLKATRMNLYEIFINMYLQEARQLVKHGIKSDYVRQEDNLNYYKGKLLVSQHIRKNMAHQERFFVAYDEFNPNRAENKLIKSTLFKLQKLTTSAENSKEIRQLLTSFEMVEPSKNYDKDFSKVVINRNTKDYELLMKWSKVFLMNKSFSTFSGKTNSRALLFPMESVYEDYVAHYVKKEFIPDGWIVHTQDKGYYLFETPKRQFALKPDIVIKRGGRIVVMDTKWKKLFDNDRKNYGISQADMYQMYAYAKKYGTSEIWLLYPENRDMRGHEPISYTSDDGVRVSIHFVDLDHIQDNLENLKTKINNYS